MSVVVGLTAGESRSALQRPGDVSKRRPVCGMSLDRCLAFGRQVVHRFAVHVQLHHVARVTPFSNHALVGIGQTVLPRLSVMALAIRLPFMASAAVAGVCFRTLM